MVTTTSHKQKVALSSRRKSQKHLLFALVTSAAAIAVNHLTPSLFPIPMNTSALTGMKWLHELLVGHPVRFSDALGMPKHVF
jgi:hypothetical protein